MIRELPPLKGRGLLAKTIKSEAKLQQKNETTKKIEEKIQKRDRINFLSPQIGRFLYVLICSNNKRHIVLYYHQWQ